MAQFKVVRTWYIEANSTTEAIEETRGRVLHDKVEAVKIPTKKERREE